MGSNSLVDFGDSCCTRGSKQPVSAMQKRRVFYRDQDGDDLVVVGVYVDDLLATDTSAEAVDRLFESLGSLSIEDLERTSRFFGVRIKLDGDRRYTLDKKKAFGDLLRYNGLKDANLTRIAIGDDRYDVQVDDAKLLDLDKAHTGPTIREFQPLVGSLFLDSALQKARHSICSA